MTTDSNIKMAFTKYLLLFIIPGFAFALSPSVLCIGDALFDCIANDDARGFTVEKMVEQSKWTAFPGGAPANVASACKKLGTSSAFCGCVGSDDDGDKLESLLKEIGVDTNLMHRSTDDSPTRRVMVTRSLDGDREFGGFYEGRSAEEFADCHLQEGSLKCDSKDLIISRARWIVCSTLSLAFPQSATTIYSIIEKALDSGVRLYVDVNWRPVFWPNHQEEDAREEIFRLCQKAHIIKLTDEEAEWLLDIPADKALADPSSIHKEFFPDSLAVLVTAGEKGAAYSMLSGSVCKGKIEPFNVPVVETTGAGDAFTAGFLHALMSVEDMEGILQESTPSQKVNDTIHDIVRFAAAVGALTCTKEGAIAAQPTFEEVESFLVGV